MKNLIRKELLLSLHPMCYLFAALSGIGMSPNEPLIVGIFFCMAADLLIFPMANVDNDLMFMASLPITKSQIVKARVSSIVLIQMIALVSMVAGSIFSNIMYPDGNVVGLSANLSLFAVSLITLAIHNIIVIPGYYKTGYRCTLPVFLGIGVSVGFGLLFGVLLNRIPSYEVLFDNWHNIPAQIIAFVLAIIIYILSVFASWKIGSKRLLKVEI